MRVARGGIAAGLLLVGATLFADADWVRLGLLSVPNVQPIAVEARMSPKETGKLVLVRKGPESAIAYREGAVPQDERGERLASLAGIRHLTVAYEVQEIPPDAFAGAAELKTVELAGRVRLIGSRAFADCPRLSCVTVPEAVRTDIAADAFAGANRHLTCFYPFSPTITAGDGWLTRGGLLFSRIAFAGGDCRNRPLFVDGDWLWSPEGSGAILLKYLGVGAKPATLPAYIGAYPVVAVSAAL